MRSSRRMSVSDGLRWHQMRLKFVVFFIFLPELVTEFCAFLVSLLSDIKSMI